MNKVCFYQRHHILLYRLLTLDNLLQVNSQPDMKERVREEEEGEIQHQRVNMRKNPKEERSRDVATNNMYYLSPISLYE